MPSPLKKRTQGEIVVIGILTLLAVAIAVVLLVGELRMLFSQTVQNILGWIMGRFASIRVPPSVVAYALAAVALLALYEGGRQLALRAFPRHHKEEICPRCGKDIHMIHRTWADRLASYALRGHLQRYRCFNCGWTGLHRQRKHRK